MFAKFLLIEKFLTMKNIQKPNSSLGLSFAPLNFASLFYEEPKVKQFPAGVSLFGWDSTGDLADSANEPLTYSTATKVELYPSTLQAGLVNSSIRVIWVMTNRFFSASLIKLQKTLQT